MTRVWLVRHTSPNKERNNIMNKNNKNYVPREMVKSFSQPTTGKDIEKLYAAVREQMNRVPYISKAKCYKIFVLNLILISGLEYKEVMSYLDSLNAYGEDNKKMKKALSYNSIEDKFDALGWKEVVDKLIELALSDNNSLAA